MKDYHGLLVYLLIHTTKYDPCVTNNNLNKNKNVPFAHFVVSCLNFRCRLDSDSHVAHIHFCKHLERLHTPLAGVRGTLIEFHKRQHYFSFLLQNCEKNLLGVVQFPRYCVKMMIKGKELCFLGDDISTV